MHPEPGWEKWTYFGDISSAQGVNFPVEKLKENGMRAVWIRAIHGWEFDSEGFFTDTTFYANWERAKKCALPRGPYLALRMVVDPLVQARAFHDVVGVLETDDLPPMIDVENFPKGMGREEFVRRMLVCAREVRRLTGRKPIFYLGSPFEWTLGASTEEELLEYLLWHAQYSTSIFHVPKPWKWPAMWQCSGDLGPRLKGFGPRPELNIRLDRNWFFGGEAAFFETMAAQTEGTPIYPLQTTRALQRALFQLGYSPGPIDNKWGPRTASAVAAFQEAEGLTKTGLFDGATQAHMQSILSHLSQATPLSEAIEAVCSFVAPLLHLDAEECVRLERLASGHA